MFQIGFEAGKAFRVSALGEGGDQPSNDSIKNRLRIAVCQLTLRNLLFVTICFKPSGAGFRLRSLSRQSINRFRPADVRSADPRRYRNEQCEPSQNGRLSRSHNAPFKMNLSKAVPRYRTMRFGASLRTEQTLGRQSMSLVGHHDDRT